jgi:hypothetical protein
MPRRLLLAAGWSATAIVAMIGPAACWSLSKLVWAAILASGHRDLGSRLYGSWLLWL